MEQKKITLDKTMIERLDEDIKELAEDCVELSKPCFDWMTWDNKEVQRIVERFSKKLKSYKELILWSDEKEI